MSWVRFPSPAPTLSPCSPWRFCKWFCKLCSPLVRLADDRPDARPQRRVGSARRERKRDLVVLRNTLGYVSARVRRHVSRIGCTLSNRLVGCRCSTPRAAGKGPHFFVTQRRIALPVFVIRGRSASLRARVARYRRGIGRNDRLSAHDGHEFVSRANHGIASEALVLGSGRLRTRGQLGRCLLLANRRREYWLAKCEPLGCRVPGSFFRWREASRQKTSPDTSSSQEQVARSP